jgi:hypothetical protein
MSIAGVLSFPPRTALGLPILNLAQIRTVAVILYICSAIDYLQYKLTFCERKMKGGDCLRGGIDDVLSY